jgi:hypothetical protein
MKCRVVLPEKSNVRAMKCCLESMLVQLHKANQDSRIVGFRIKPDRSWEIEMEEMPDEKLF